MTLLYREATDRPVRRPSLVEMELNIDGERRESGVDFAIKRDIVPKMTEMQHQVSDIIMTMRIPLTKDRNATIVSAYAPTMANHEENK